MLGKPIQLEVRERLEAQLAMKTNALRKTLADSQVQNVPPKTWEPSKAVRELKRLACCPLSLRLCLGEAACKNGEIWALSSPAALEQRKSGERSLISDSSDVMAIPWFPGERAKDQEGLLQGLQEAHDDEGHPVQDREGLSLRPGYVRYGPDGGNRGASCGCKRCANSHGSACCPRDVDLISSRQRITVSVLTPLTWAHREEAIRP